MCIRDSSTDVYICNKECKGISPDTLMSDGSTNPWTKLSLKGEQGEPGANFSYQGTWDSLKKYSETNLVWFNNTLYFSLQNDNLGHAPNEADSTYWKAWVYAMPDGSVTVEKLSENVLTLITNSTVLIDKTTGFKYYWELDNGKLYVVKN